MAVPTLQDMAGSGAFDPVEAIRALANEIAAVKRQQASVNMAVPPNGATAEGDPLVVLLGNNRMSSLLRKANFKTIAELQAASDEEIIRIDGIGQKGLDLIRGKLADESTTGTT